MHQPPRPAPQSSARVHGGRRVERVLIVTLVLNLTNFAIKLGVGLVSGNLTVLSDAFHGLLDSANNIVGIFVLRLSWRPPDASHPYGHRKIEALASLGIGMLMALTSWEILKRVMGRLFLAHQPELPQLHGLWLGLILIGLGINLTVALYERWQGRRLGSPFLVADAAHTRADVLVTVLSLVSLVVEAQFQWLDALLALLVVGLIIHAGWVIVRDNMMVLTDRVQIDPDRVRRVVEALDQVSNAHSIRSQGMPDDIHLDLHVVIPPDLSAHEAHEIEHRVRSRLKQVFPEIGDISIQHQTHPPNKHHKGSPGQDSIQ